MVSFEMDERLHALTPCLNQSWMFCVDNKLFTSGLAEYYRERLSASVIISLDKADAWTLEYFVKHGQQIAIAIDSDNSGFIRISEVNAFTNRIPNGWNLPQWCAYTIAGWCTVYLDSQLLI